MQRRRVGFKIVLALLTTALIAGVGQVAAFCGFYVAKADVGLFNKASQVIIARDGNRTVVTMSSDFRGNAKDFAIVVPVPVTVRKDQVKVGEQKIFDRIDSYTAPRLVEYFDSDPCRVYPRKKWSRFDRSAAPVMEATKSKVSNKALGITIEAKFSVGEYDIVVLGAKQSAGLEIWLKRNGYRMPPKARSLLRPYIRQQMKFFVAKVNLKRHRRSGFQNLRPIMMAYESPRFMLPIRLGMINAQQAQDLIVYVLSPKGRAEVSNYRMVKIPSNVNLPVHVKSEFAKFYPAMFEQAYQREGRNAVFLEYAWDMRWCDPCAANPLSAEELRKAGVFWQAKARGGAANVYVTRLHVRYTRDKFPQDLRFQETPNRKNFQGRYILRHAFKGNLGCSAGGRYQQQLLQRQEREAQQLAHLTGWDINRIRKKIGIRRIDGGKDSWWNTIFKSG